MIYGYAIGGGGGGKSGATLTVTAPVGSTVTVSKGAESYSSGLLPAVFKGLSSGTWVIDYTNGPQVGQATINIAADYAITVTYFAATINITYPAGSTCTVSKSGTTLTAPDTSGTWACTVPEAGTWTVRATQGSNAATKSVNISASGQSVSVQLTYGTLVGNGTRLVDVSNSLIPSKTDQPPFRAGMKSVSINTSNSQLIVTENNIDLASSWVVFDGTFNLANFATLTAKFKFTQYGNTENYFILAVLSSDLSAILAYGQQNYIGSTAASENTQNLSIASLTGTGKLAFAVSTQSVDSVGICKIIDFIIQ